MASINDKVRQKALAALKVLNQLGSVRAAFVFGSQTDGSADSWSDVDLAAFMDGIESWDMRRRAQVMARVQREVALDLETHLFLTRAMQAGEAGSFTEYIITHGVCVYQR